MSSPVTAQLIDSVRTEVADQTVSGPADSPLGLAERLQEAVRRRSGGLGAAETLSLLREVEAELTGTGPLATVLADPEVTDVLVNAPAAVWVDRGEGLQRADVAFGSEAEVRRLAVRLAGLADRRLDVAAPYVDARLPAGIRLHAVLPPIAVGGTCLSLRVHRGHLRDLAYLRGRGALPPELADVLRALIDARVAFLISGGAGTGKTTLLGALLGQVAGDERLVVVEDAAELVAEHPHLVRLEARPANVEGAGEVTLRDLVRQALRMRPDRLIVGEVRGPELLDLLLAANTGHDGGLTTLHANGVADVPARVEALAMLAGVTRPAAHALLASAFRVAVQLRRSRDGQRCVAEVALLEAESSGLVATRPVLSWAGPGAALVRGPGAEALAELLRTRGAAAPAVLSGALP